MRPNWRDLAELVRAPAALSVPGDVVAGAAAAGRLGPRTAGLAGSSVLLYWAGMAANDWADRELDAVERPERPIPSGRITPGTALGVAAGLTAAGVAVAGLAGGRKALAIAVPLAGAVWAYDLKLKNTPAGPAAMATCRALDVLLGASGGRLRKAMAPAATVFAHTYTVTALSRAEVHGASPELPAATLVGTAVVAASAAVSRNRGWRALVPAGLVAWYARRYGEPQLRAFDKPSPENVRASVGAGILNLPTLQGALTARAGSPVAGVAVAAAAPLARQLSKRLSPT
ncbi:UbiA family prenyltransferase [Dactylosporangium fulvum]|uniref:UbiA family prenyltransferase n=1 Tax=Dactylosporangium fulvum TaxID=53359 RepID=A0ABY5W5P1_9ACTN|nr:UbiA family prenyltransferase [Dactylosporangium fulvum]UWP84651.1 UbiA family prenyltransferase [Dactylosporangium fulvum]